MIYLDNNATTALDESVLEAMLPYMGICYGNPSSVHRFGRLQRDAIEASRQQVAKLVGAHSDQVIFTSGGTESNNLVIRGFNQSTVNKTIAVSAIEHMSILEACLDIDQVAKVAVDSDGIVTEENLLQALTDQTGLVSVMMANNETGVIQPIKRLAEVCRQKDLFFHTDISQAAAKIEVDFSDLGVSAMTLSAHKMFGPVGAGALICDQRLILKPQQYGGKQEKDLRAGTENVAAIVGFGKAAELALERLSKRQVHCLQLRNLLEEGLHTLPEASIFAEEANRLPNTVQFGVAGFDGESLLMQLDRKGIAVSAGSACTSGKSEPSHVLQAMNVEKGIALAALRISFSEHNTIVDVEQFLKALKDIIQDNTHSSVMMAAGL